MKIPPIAALLLAAGALSAGCARASPRGGAAEKTHLYRAVAPHDGTVVALGDDYNLELVCDGDTGILSAYVLDDELEEFVRSPTPAIAILAKAGGQDQNLVLTAVGNPATGETVGDTSLFQAQADWLRRTPTFSGTLQSVTVRGTAFTGVRFAFPAVGAKE